MDLDDVYGQMKLSEETSRQCVFALTGESSADNTDSKNGFTELLIYPQYFKKPLTKHLETAHRPG